MREMTGQGVVLAVVLAIVLGAVGCGGVSVKPNRLKEVQRVAIVGLSVYETIKSDDDASPNLSSSFRDPGAMNVYEEVSARLEGLGWVVLPSKAVMDNAAYQELAMKHAVAKQEQLFRGTSLGSWSMPSGGFNAEYGISGSDVLEEIPLEARAALIEALEVDALMLVFVHMHRKETDSIIFTDDCSARLGVELFNARDEEPVWSDPNASALAPCEEGVLKKDIPWRHNAVKKAVQVMIGRYREAGGPGR